MRGAHHENISSGRGGEGEVIIRLSVYTADTVVLAVVGSEVRQMKYFPDNSVLLPGRHQHCHLVVTSSTAIIAH